MNELGDSSMDDPDIEDINDIDQVFVGFDKKKLTKKRKERHKYRK